MSKTEFGAFLERRMDELGILQKNLAEAIHVSTDLIANWKSGKRTPANQHVQAIMRATIRPPAVPDATEFLERRHVHELLRIHLRSCGLAPGWPIDIVDHEKQLEAAILLATREAESLWFRFIAEQQSRLLSLINDHSQIQLRAPPASSATDRSQASTIGNPPTQSQPGGRSLDKKGQDFLMSLLAQIEFHGPDYTAARGRSTWRVAILTPTRRGDFLRIKWHSGLSTEAESRNAFYIGSHPDSGEHKRGIAGTVYVKPVPLWFASNVSAEDRYKDCYNGERAPHMVPYTSMAALPIYTPGIDNPAVKVMIGVLCFDSPSYPFDEHDRELLEPLATLCALCIRTTQMSCLTEDIVPN